MLPSGELVGLFAVAGTQPELFLFFLAGLVVLEKTEDPVLISRAFELPPFYLGYLPTLDTCAHCGAPLDTGDKKRSRGFSGGRWTDLYQMSTGA